MTKPIKAYGDKWQGLDGTTIDFGVYYKRQTNRFWANYKENFKNFISGSTVLARFDTYASSEQTIQVSLKGFTSAITVLAKACSK